MLRAFTPGQLLLRNLYRDIVQRVDWSSVVTISDASKADLRWWLSVLDSWDGAPLCDKAVQCQVSTDASGFGWGRHFLDFHASGSWKGFAKNLHSNDKELLAIFLTLKSFWVHLSQKVVQVLCDNVTTCAYINRMGGNNVFRNHILRQMWQFCEQHNIVLSAKFLQGNKNVLTDQLSRQSSKYDWTINLVVVQRLQDLWGKFTIDRFASMHTAQVEIYNSFFWDPKTSGVDALAQQDWDQHLNFINAPIFLLPRVVQKIMYSQAEAIVVVPRWRGQAWYQKLKALAKCPPVRLPHVYQLVYQHGGSPPEIWKNPKWVMEAWRVSGKWH